MKESRNNVGLVNLDWISLLQVIQTLTNLRRPKWASSHLITLLILVVANERRPSWKEYLALNLKASRQSPHVGPVWPDVRIKRRPIFPEGVQKVATSVLNEKNLCFKIAQRFAKILGNFCMKICNQDFSKIAQFGYTCWPFLKCEIQVF